MMVGCALCSSWIISFGIRSKYAAFICLRLFTTLVTSWVVIGPFVVWLASCILRTSDAVTTRRLTSFRVCVLGSFSSALKWDIHWVVEMSLGMLSVSCLLLSFLSIFHHACGFDFTFQSMVFMIFLRCSASFRFNSCA